MSCKASRVTKEPSTCSKANKWVVTKPQCSCVSGDVTIRVSAQKVSNYGLDRLVGDACQSRAESSLVNPARREPSIICVCPCSLYPLSPLSGARAFVALRVTADARRPRSRSADCLDLPPARLASRTASGKKGGRISASECVAAGLRRLERDDFRFG